MLNQEEVRSLFLLAGFKVLRIEALIDGYGYSPEDPRYITTPPRCAWWFVKTEFGWIKIGNRKRVIEIEWEDTGLAEGVLTNAEVLVSNGPFYIHAYTTVEVLAHLTALKLCCVGSKQDQGENVREGGEIG